MRYPNDLSFQFYNPTRIVFGPGSARDAGTELGNLGCRKAFLVTDKVLRTTTDIVGRVQKALGSAFAGIFDEVPPDSGVDIVEKCAAQARAAGADSLVSVGGGSVIDTTKGAAILLTEGGSLLDYQGFQMLTRRQTPHLCIPTTAGTGSEVTYAAVIKDHEAKRKLLFADYHIIPDTAILDPELTLGLPRSLTAATGMDAFSHALEAITSIQREPVADALGLRAIALVAEYLPRAVKDGADLGARGQMLIASNIAGAAFSNAQVGLIHAIAHVLGGRFGIHHGVANAVAMPYVVRFNNGEAADRHAAIGQAMGLDLRGRSEEAAGLETAKAIQALNRELGLPASLRELGVPEDQLSSCAEAALGDGSIVYNARTVMEAEELRGLLRSAWLGEPL
jgi:alcohol dehydrogenase class IV